jgi:hypothetical protein
MKLKEGNFCGNCLGEGSVPLHSVADWVAYIAGTVSSNSSFSIDFFAFEN